MSTRKKKFVLLFAILAAIFVVLFWLVETPTAWAPESIKNNSETARDIKSEDLVVPTSSTVSTSSDSGVVFWQSFVNSDTCYSLRYPSNFSVVTTSDSNVVTITNGATGIDEKFVLQIHYVQLPADKSLESFIAQENSGVQVEREESLPDDITTSLFEVVGLGAFQYHQHTFASPGGVFDTYVAPANNANYYYQVLAWSNAKDTDVLKTILGSFVPMRCAAKVL